MRYKNPHLSNERRTIWDAFLWKLGFYNDADHAESPPCDFSYPTQPNRYDPAAASAVWIGHSTYLVQEGGRAFLTDPVWATHCAPVTIRSFKRQHPPSLSLQELPPLTAVLLSHNHYDHLDAKVAKALSHVLWIVPEGLGSWFRKRGIRHKELKWGESMTLDGCEITSVPAQHFSGRSLWDHDRTHWCGYVVRFPSQKQLYFVGDTGYNPIDFKKIGETYGPMDLSLIPIGTYRPRAFMSPVHISPYEAVQIHREVKSRLSLGMHWKTFRLSEEPLNRPPYDLYLALKAADLPFSSFLPVEPGVYVNW